MYSIKGHDGYVYGPAELNQIEQWVAEGRVVPNTVLIDHVTDTEGPAMHFPLVARYFPSVSPPVVPNLRQPSVPPTAIGTPHTVQPQVVVNNYVGGGPVPVAFDSGYKQKVVAGLLALFLGCLGIHQFYLGKNGLGVTMLLITVLTCGYGSLITGIWALIDAICIFTGSTRDAQGRILV